MFLVRYCFRPLDCTKISKGYSRSFRRFYQPPPAPSSFDCSKNGFKMSLVKNPSPSMPQQAQLLAVKPILPFWAVNHSFFFFLGGGVFSGSPMSVWLRDSKWKVNVLRFLRLRTEFNLIYLNKFCFTISSPKTLWNEISFFFVSKKTRKRTKV